MVDVWASLVVVYNCGVGVRVRVDDNEGIYIHDKICGCVPDWFHKVCKVCTVRMGIDWLVGPGRKWLVWGRGLLGIGRCTCHQVLLPMRHGCIDISSYILGILLCVFASS